MLTLSVQRLLQQQCKRALSEMRLDTNLCTYLHRGVPSIHFRFFFVFGSKLTAGIVQTTPSSVADGAHPLSMLIYAKRTMHFTLSFFQSRYGGKYKLPIFIYSCPSSSQRTDRMLYATTKQAVLDHVISLDKKHAPRKVEISDPEDLTDSDLTGIADKSAPVNEPVTSTVPKVEKFAPGELAGSLGSLMLGLHGQKPTGKKIIRPPPGAYG